MEELIRIRGARTHNLRSVDIDVPRGRFVVFSGVSGSGKSSLVFDTLFAEGQRRYIESLSPFVRQYLDQMERPDVDLIEGLPPTLSISQSGLDRARNPRSIVATLTEIHDYLRLLYARAGDVFCYQCGEPLGMQSVEEIIHSITSLPEGERLLILAPLARGKKGEHRDTIGMIRREGFVRARIDGELVLIDPPPKIDPNKAHDIEMVVDRQIVRPELSSRLAESIETALRFGNGTVIIALLDGDKTFNTRLACSRCGICYRELEPRTFSFNSPYGACTHCQGLGIVQEFSSTKVIPNPMRSLSEGAVAPFRTKSGRPTAAFARDLANWATDEKIVTQPFQSLPDDLQKELWNGSSRFKGIKARMESLRESLPDDAKGSLTEYMNDSPCSACHGARLAPEGRSVRLGGLAIHEFLALTIEEARGHWATLHLRDDRAEIAQPLLEEVQHRLDYLAQVGVGYIALDRPVWTLSGGEAQRIRLASCVGSGLNGVCYILDEPTIGLHPRDTEKLLDVLTSLKSRDNSILVVEHDSETMRRADYIVDLGPGAGPHGGTIIEQGTYLEFVNGSGVTADYLSGRRRIERVNESNGMSNDLGNAIHSPPLITLENVTYHNLQQVTLRVPTVQLVSVTGVSGSGKSSLIIDVFVPLIRRTLGLSTDPPPVEAKLSGLDGIKNVVEVDQQPIGRTPRSCPASFVGILDLIRVVFSKSREARLRGFGAGRFSFNSKEGQCPECEGLGARRIDLKFMPDLFVPCTTCRGRRFNRATLSIKFKGKSIGDVLDMTVEEAASFFESHPRVSRTLATLQDVGLGYLKLGQWGTTLSGGEAQRLKLATELARPNMEPTLYVLDEPTTGLHFQDVEHLLRVLSKLVDQGHTVLVIEHHLDVIAASDWIIDLGPEGGREGGRIVAEGPPQTVAHTHQTPTATALRKHLQGR